MEGFKGGRGKGGRGLTVREEGREGEGPEGWWRHGEGAAKGLTEKVEKKKEVPRFASFLLDDLFCSVVT